MQLAFTFQPRPIVCAGALATEAALLDLVREELEASRRDPKLLALPVRVVVPSKSLRRHVAATLARDLGPGLLGVVVQTLHGVAREIAGRVEPAPVLEQVFALRMAREQPALHALLDDYEEGDRAIVESVRQVLDAGFLASHAEAATEALAAAEGLSDSERDRAAAVVRAAAGTERILAALTLDTPNSVLRTAADLLAGGARLPARRLILHGVADATGVAADLLEALGRLPVARLLVNLPPDPAQPTLTDSSATFGARLRERLGATGAPSRTAPTPALEVVSAEGDDGEALEVARRVIRLVDGGVRPEAIGIVAKDLTARGPALRRHLAQLGVPFSGLGQLAPDTPEARWRGVGALLHNRDRLSADRWVELLGSLDQDPLDMGLRADLRLAIRAIGVARLDQLDAVDVEGLLRGKADFTLPGGFGLDGDRPLHRTLPAPRIRALFAAARGYLAWARTLPDRAPRDTWVALLGQLVTDVLGHPPAHPVHSALGRLAELPALEFAVDEIRLVLADLLADFGSGPIGGRGGGVQVLSVREARGRVFGHLFLLGNQRQPGFPQDVVLSDPIRLALRAVLPDLPLRRDRFDEDRFHFAWLLSSAPAVTITWQSVDRTGRAGAISPLVERLRWGGRWSEATVALPPFAEFPVRSAASRLTAAQLHRHATDRLWTRTIEEARPDGIQAPSAAAVAAARIGVGAEKDNRHRQGPGPYMGWLGVHGPHLDNRLSVSFVESYAACPWKALLQRRLSAQPVPDPLETIPAADALITGSVVHKTLERVIGAQLPHRIRSVAEIADTAGTALVWPPLDRMAALAETVAEELLEQAGVRLPGLAKLMTRRLIPLLEVARTVDAKATPIAVELQGGFEVDGRTIEFRADRVDRHEGDLRFTDYKTGKPFTEVLRLQTRAQHLLDNVARGKNLQAAAYAAVAGTDDRVQGRFLYLRPDVELHEIRAFSGTEDLRAALDGTVRTVLHGLEAGVFFPRLVKPDDDEEPSACATCEVSEACIRGETTDRIRLRDWAREQGRPGALTEGADDAMMALWWLTGKAGG